MPYKVCTNCGKQCGVRTTTCSCGTAFNASTKKLKGQSDNNTVKPEKEKPAKEKPVSTKVVNRQKSKSYRKTYVAAGECPVKPKGFVGGKWITDPTDDDIREWVIACYNSAPEGEEYLPHAIEYWAHDFWGYQLTDEFDRVTKIIYVTLLDERNMQADDLDLE